MEILQKNVEFSCVFIAVMSLKTFFEYMYLDVVFGLNRVQCKSLDHIIIILIILPPYNIIIQVAHLVLVDPDTIDMGQGCGITADLSLEARVRNEFGLILEVGQVALDHFLGFRLHQMFEWINEAHW
jgi:hypothetical protein